MRKPSSGVDYGCSSSCFFSMDHAEWSEWAAKPTKPDATGMHETETYHTIPYHTAHLVRHPIDEAASS
jgi:hypothetical protein